MASASASAAGVGDGGVDDDDNDDDDDDRVSCSATAFVSVSVSGSVLFVEAESVVVPFVIESLSLLVADSVLFLRIEDMDPYCCRTEYRFRSSSAGRSLICRPSA